ncbi:growth hormone-inducible transmembrane protein-like [Ruditapes philippinarum]|uniref:growth hormone-inducible transmembrane protein-like n=1 Tax=Ruditapes philippinarum TaxID=129788 RepID=UPI00295A9A4E|nr:growth hormone-inducible transmembrane protein-like [Ruditapes philippinarum]
MFAARLSGSCVPLTAFVSSLSKGQSIKPVLRSYNVTRIQRYASQPKSSRFARRQNAQSQTFKEKLMAPAGEGAFTAGRGLLIAASGVGLGMLAFYGMGLSNETGVLENSVLWPEYVRARVRATYMYFGGGIALTAASAVAVSRNPRIMSMMTRNSLLAMGGTIAAIIGTNILCHSIPYKPGFGAKQLAWMVHAGVLGAVVAPLTYLGGPLLLRAAWLTAGVVGGLSTVAMCAPSEKFLNIGGPLACGFGLVFASSIAGMFLPPTTALGAGLYSISIYGGLVLFGMFLLYDTQKIMKRAETHPPYAMQPYDPVNASLGIYADTLNIFIRIAMILAGGGGKRK